MNTYYMISDGLKYEFERRTTAESHGKVRYSQEDMDKEFPISKQDLLGKYVTIERILNEKWHPNATLGAAINGDGLLTDHGVEHVSAVMHNAYEILGPNLRYLSGYEIYLLLLAIHFHDLGNIYGRQEHEQKIYEVMMALGDSLELDAVEKEFILAISQAHGGYIEGDRDTIRFVNVDETCNTIPIRAKVLASVLRFADEISDDFSRAMYKGIQVPKENEVYHLYSETLEPVSIQGETIKFHYRIPYEYTQKKIGKNNTEVFLYDEVLERLAKCMRELEYCRKYGNGFINISTLNVKIDIVSDLKVKEKFSFRLTLLGYPNKNDTKLENYIERENEVCGAGEPLLYKNGEVLKCAMGGKVDE